MSCALQISSFQRYNALTFLQDVFTRKQCSFLNSLFHGLCIDVNSNLNTHSRVTSQCVGNSSSPTSCLVQVITFPTRPPKFDGAATSDSVGIKSIVGGKNAVAWAITWSPVLERTIRCPPS